MPQLNRVAIFTNEYPPNVYGGAGVHVEYLTRELAKLVPVEVRCFGDQNIHEGNLRVKGYGPWKAAGEDTDPRFKGVLDSFHRDLAMARDRLDADVVHCHTWYTDMAGFLARELWDIPFVLTVHSLEPLRPWKVEQLGNGYLLSSWMERTAIEAADAIVAVSQETRNDILRLFAIQPGRVHVIHNGIDLAEFREDPDVDALSRYGIDPKRPYVLFVGRITRQKGIFHLLNAVPMLDPSLQVVLCANTPDTREIGEEMEDRVPELSRTRSGVIWIDQKIPREDLIQLYSHATVFCCPSIYESFGIINLEAMACETPVVASAVGGIIEVVVPDETGLLVYFERENDGYEPADPARFARDLAEAINRVATDPALAERLGKNGRKRVEEHFSWTAIAQQTMNLYQALLSGKVGAA